MKIDSPRVGSSRLTKVALLPILALAFGARLFRLADASIWYDEGLTVWAARSRIVDMVQWTSADVHPPLYFMLIHYWRRFAGDSELAVRFPSVVFGTLSVVALYALGRALLPKQPEVATLAALLLALSRFSVWWSQEARMYELAALLALFNLLFAVRLRSRFRAFDVAGYLVVTIASFWTLYLLAFLLVIDGAYWFMGLSGLPTVRARLSAFAGWSALEGVSVAAVAPWLAYALPRMHSWSNADSTSPVEFAKLYASLLSLGISTNVDSVQGPALAIAGLALAGAIIAFTRRAPAAGRPAAMLFLAVALPPLVLWGLMIVPRSTGYVPRPQARYLLPYAGAFFLLVAWGVNELARLFPGRRPRRFAFGALIVAVLGVQVWSLADYDAGLLRADDYVSVAATLHAYERAGDAVLLDTNDTWPVFAYHFDRPFVGIPEGQKVSPEWITAFVGPVWASHDATWLVINERALPADPQHLVEGWLGSRAVATHTWRFGTRQAILYARVPERAALLTALAPDFQPPPPRAPLVASGLRLAGWEQPLTRAAAGDTLNLALDVSGPADNGEVQVSLGDPTLIVRRGAIPSGSGLKRAEIPLIVPAGAPGGRYPLIAELGSARGIEGWIDVIPRPVDPSAVSITPESTDNVSFGQPTVARLVGHGASPTLQPGQTTKVTLYWQAVAPISTSYKVFVHFLDATNHVGAQHDDFPVGGERPTTSWRPGETFVDRYDVPLPANLPPGTYTLEVGFYDPATGTRLGPVVAADGTRQQDDRVVLGVATAN